LTKPGQRIFTFASAALLAVLVLSTAGLHYAERYPPHSAPAPPGVPNFGEVSPFLFRGGQPSEEGFQGLKSCAWRWW